AVHLAELEHAQLSLVYAIGDMHDKEVLVAIGTKYGSKAIVRKAYELSKKSAMKWLAPIEDMATKKGINVKKEILFEYGKSIVQLLVDYAEKSHIDLIVIGTRGRTKFKRLLLGSVASGVLAHAKCTVVAVR
ncbi:MAG: universal stress protein, partial [Clostridia bacterium]